MTVTHDDTNSPLGGGDSPAPGSESSVASAEAPPVPADGPTADPFAVADEPAAPDPPAADPFAVAEAESEDAESEEEAVASVTVDATAEVEDAELDEEEEPYVVSPYDRPGRWYVVHTYAGYENKVKSNLHSRTASMNMEDRIYEVVIPMEDVVEFKNGKKVVVQKKVFPGYLLCRCELDDDSWSVIRNTPGVTGFVGPGTKPTPLSRREVEGILQVKIEGGEAPSKRTRPRLEHEVGETVRVKKAPSQTSRARSPRSTRTSSSSRSWSTSSAAKRRSSSSSARSRSSTARRAGKETHRCHRRNASSRS